MKKPNGRKATKLEPVTVTITSQCDLAWLHKAASLTGKPVQQEARTYIRFGSRQVIDFHKANAKNGGAVA